MWRSSQIERNLPFPHCPSHVWYFNLATVDMECLKKSPFLSGAPFYTTQSWYYWFGFLIKVKVSLCGWMNYWVLLGKTKLQSDVTLSPACGNETEVYSETYNPSSNNLNLAKTAYQMRRLKRYVNLSCFRTRTKHDCFWWVWIGLDK